MKPSAFIRVHPGFQSLLVASLLSACTLGPDFRRPDVDLPKDLGVAQSNVPAPERWWTLFADPMLDRLVDEAIANNRDVRAAAARVDQARALYTAARADQIPTAGVQAQSARTHASSRAGGFPLPPEAIETNDHRVVLRAAWEIDFWGKYRRASEAAFAEVFAADSAADAVRASLVADVVRGYFNLRALDRRLESIGRTLDGRRQALEMQRTRFELGAISELELRQVESELRSAEALLPTTRQQRAQQEGALALLLGRSPRDVIEARIASADARIPDSVEVPSGLPSELLLRRPDLRQAEARLHAANARIGVARAAYFPSISLTGYYGGESQQLGDLFTGPARTWNIAAGLTQPLFAGGQIRGAVEAAEARTREAAELYQKAVSNAFREVRDALFAQANAREALAAQAARERALERTYALARLRYDNGAVSFFEVLDAERQLLAARLEAADAERARAAAIVDLYLALGL